MNEPTADDLSRDLAADMATCDAATGGPWIDMGDTEPYAGQVIATPGGKSLTVVFDSPEMDDRPDDRRFAVEAREGWPAAIRRALAAEAILDAPLVALFADGRQPTTNERHLLHLLSWREKEAAEAKTKKAEGAS
jgi:hypothetical protein